MISWRGTEDERERERAGAGREEKERRVLGGSREDTRLESVSGRAVR